MIIDWLLGGRRPSCPPDRNKGGSTVQYLRDNERPLVRTDSKFPSRNDRNRSTERYRLLIVPFLLFGCLSANAQTVEVTVGGGGTATVAEGDAIEFSVTVRGTAGETYTVEYKTATSETTAKPGTDYTSVESSRSVVMGSAEESFRFSVQTIENDRYDGDRNFKVLVVLREGTALTDSAGLEVTIEEDDPRPTVELSLANAEVAEGSGSVMVTALLTGEETRETNVTVKYST